MKRLLKALQYLVSGVAALILVAAAAVYGFSEARYRKLYAVEPKAIAIPSDSAAIARGAHLVQTFGGCIECHGENLGGKLVLDDPAIGRVYGANLTRGKGGVGGERTDADLIRAIRHGLAPTGRPLKVMPSTDYVHLAEADLAAIVAYVKSRPPVDNVQPSLAVGPVGRALFVAGKMPILSAELIDHGSPVPAPIPAGATAEYGSYIAKVGCQGCHGSTLAGGPIVGGAPDWPPAANLTPAGALKSWTEADFVRLLRTGKRPNGIPVNPLMPWKLTTNMNDDEIRAVWLYLQTLPATPTGGLRTASR